MVVYSRTSEQQAYCRLCDRRWPGPTFETWTNRRVGANACVCVCGRLSLAAMSTRRAASDSFERIAQTGTSGWRKLVGGGRFRVTFRSLVVAGNLKSDARWSLRLVCNQLPFVTE